MRLYEEIGTLLTFSFTLLLSASAFSAVSSSASDDLQKSVIIKVEIPFDAQNVDVSRPMALGSGAHMEVVVSYDTRDGRRIAHTKQPLYIDSNMLRSATSLAIRFTPKIRPIHRRVSDHDCYYNVVTQNWDDCRNIGKLTPRQTVLDAQENPEECSFNILTQNWDDCDDHNVWFGRAHR
jgi:hypothetical protein